MAGLVPSPFQEEPRFVSNYKLLFCSRILDAWQLHPSETACEAGLAHLLEHLLHLGILTKKIVYFLNASAGAAGNALAAAAVDDFVVIALVHGHRTDNGLDTVDLFFVDVVGGFLQARKRSDAGKHTNQALHRSHLLNLAELVAEIFQREAIAGERLGGHLLGFFLVDLLLRPLDE